MSFVRSGAEANFCVASSHAHADLTSNAVDPSSLSTLSVQHELADAWTDLSSTSLPTASAQVHVLGSIEEAVQLVRQARGGGGGQGEGEAEVEVEECLVTGSLHLVGGVMEVAGLRIS